MLGVIQIIVQQKETFNDAAEVQFFLIVGIFFKVGNDGIDFLGFVAVDNAQPLPKQCFGGLVVCFFFRIFGFFRQYRWFGMPKQRVGFVGRRSLRSVFTEKQQCQ